MKERADFMATQPGFISVSLHRSQDGSHVVNYVQWANAEKLTKAHHAPEFRKKWPKFGELVKEVEPCLYEVVHTKAADKARARSIRQRVDEHGAAHDPEKLPDFSDRIMRKENSAVFNPAACRRTPPAVPCRRAGR